jgi:hypothetical protein
LQGHGRGQTGDLLHVRRTDLLQQPAGVRRDGLEVPALRLGVERAEGQRGLARTGDAGEGDHGIAGYVDVDVPKVVLGGAPDVHEPVINVVFHQVCLPCSAAPNHRHERSHPPRRRV